MVIADDEPWASLPSSRIKEPPISGPLPGSVEVVLGNQLYVDRMELPPPLVNRITRLAAFQNPEFYAAQAMRLPTFGKPRIISCAELFPKHIALPRGCLDDLLSVLGKLGIAIKLRDERQQGVEWGSNRQMHPFRSIGVVGTACRKGQPGNWGRPARDGGRALPVPHRGAAARGLADFHQPCAARRTR